MQQLLSLCLVLRNTHTISYNLIKRLFIQNKYIWACSFIASNPSLQLTILKIAKKLYVCFITIQNVNMKTCLWRWCPWLYDVVLLWYYKNIHCRAKLFEYMLHFYILFKILMNLLCTVWLLWSQICIDTYWLKMKLMSWLLIGCYNEMSLFKRYSYTLIFSLIENVT